MRFIATLFNLCKIKNNTKIIYLINQIFFGQVYRSIKIILCVWIFLEGVCIRYMNPRFHICFPQNDCIQFLKFIMLIIIFNKRRPINFKHDYSISCYNKRFTIKYLKHFNSKFANSIRCSVKEYDNLNLDKHFFWSQFKHLSTSRKYSFVNTLKRKCRLILD